MSNLLKMPLINSVCMPASCSAEQVIEFLSNDFQLWENFDIDGDCDETDGDFTGYQSLDIATM